MRASRRIAVLGMAAASALSLAAGPAEAEQRGLQPVGTDLRPVRAGKAEWVDIEWKTGRRVCHVQVKVRGRDIDVAYPGGRGFTSFAGEDSSGTDPGGADLRAGERDHTAFRVTVTDGDADRERLTATVRYDLCRRNSPVLEDAFGLWLPIRDDKSE